MNDQKFENDTLAFAKREVASKSVKEIISKYYTPLSVPVELARKLQKDSKYADWFVKEVDTINKHEDTLLLVCISYIYSSVMEADRQSGRASLMPELSDNTLGFVQLIYLGTKRLVNNERAAEIFPENEPTNKSDDLEDFEWVVTVTIGRLYKKSPLWKQKLMWQLLKEWNSPKFNIGVPRLIKEKIGEDEALKLFREIANKIMNDPELLKQAVDDYQKSNPFAQN